MRLAPVCLGLLLLGSACGPDAAPDATSAVDEYPDAIRRAIDRMAAEPRPVPNSALPPRHLDEDRFPESLVSRDEIVSGGPPADAIASIDEPRFASAREVEGLAADEPVLVMRLDGITRAYPVRILLLHEIVNDDVAGRPVTVSYCPLCNSGTAFVGIVAGEPTTFGTSGSLYRSALVMYDRATESLWTHFDGRAVLGERVGEQLESIPIATMAFGDLVAESPDADVLVSDLPLPYGRNPYGAYDQRDAPLAGFFSAALDDRSAPMTRVVGTGSGDGAVAVPLAVVADEGVVAVEADGAPVSIWFRPGLRSPLGGATVSDGAEIGATAAFATDEMFQLVGEVIVDDATGSVWNILGEAVDGPRTGERLEAVPHLDTFWFAWAGYHPQTALVTG